MPDIYFVIEGKARPQGSKTAYVRGGRAVLVEANKGLKTARLAASATIHRTAYEDKWIMPPADTPIIVQAVFVFRRPKSAVTRMFNTVKPDLDKLVRYALDALVQAGNVIIDDNQVVEIKATKIYGRLDQTNLVVSYDA
jgi:Holliday junction resolvase RusA-like endonuclease